jgi:hypothetical protein
MKTDETLRRPSRRVWLSTVVPAAISTLSARAEVVTKPVFKVDVASPTKDKPQSKLWFAHGSWWAWLPVRGGSGIWRRTASGWQRQTSLDEALRGFPGQADVLAESDEVTAVLVEEARLAGDWSAVE